MVEKAMKRWMSYCEVMILFPLLGCASTSAAQVAPMATERTVRDYLRSEYVGNVPEYSASSMRALMEFLRSPDTFADDAHPVEYMLVTLVELLEDWRQQSATVVPEMLNAFPQVQVDPAVLMQVVGTVIPWSGNKRQEIRNLVAGVSALQLERTLDARSGARYTANFRRFAMRAVASSEVGNDLATGELTSSLSVSGGDVSTQSAAAAILIARKASGELTAKEREAALSSLSVLVRSKSWERPWVPSRIMDPAGAQSVLVLMSSYIQWMQEEREPPKDMISSEDLLSGLPDPDAVGPYWNVAREYVRLMESLDPKRTDKILMSKNGLVVLAALGCIKSRQHWSEERLQVMRKLADASVPMVRRRAALLVNWK